MNLYDVQDDEERVRNEEETNKSTSIQSDISSSVSTLVVKGETATTQVVDNTTTRKISATTTTTRAKCKVYVRISGISPFVLLLNKGLELQHYSEIIDTYYSQTLYKGNPPSPLYIYKVVNFNNGDKLFEYKRRPLSSNSCQTHLQQKNINEPSPSEDHYISFTKNPFPELCPLNEIPKYIGLNRLIMKLTDPHGDDFIERVFWYTYRKLAKPIVVLIKLLERFDSEDIIDEDEDGNEEQYFTTQEKQYYHLHLKPGIQKRVISVINNWIDVAFFDWDDRMIALMNEFCDSITTQQEYVREVQQMRDKMHQRSREEMWKRASSIDKLFFSTTSSQVTPTGTTAAIIPADEVVTPSSETTEIINTTGSSATTRMNEQHVSTNTQILQSMLHSMSEQEIAEQLTYIDSILYHEIHYSEMLNQAWNKDDRRHTAPNIIANTSFFNSVGNWVAYSILIISDLKERRKLLNKFLILLNHLYDLNSLNMIMAVSGGLNNTSIHRLSLTWEGIDEKTMQSVQKVLDLGSASNNSKALRSRMKELYDEGQPCCPFAGVYLKDLVFVDDGNPTFIDGKINFVKCAQQYNMMHQVLRFQGRRYHNLSPNHSFIQEILKRYKMIDDNTLYKMSLDIQPRKS